MRTLPLSAKIALWSFALAIMTMGIGYSITAYVLRQEIVSVVQQRAERISKEILGALDHLPPNPTAITKDMLPKSASGIPVEITTAGGESLYRTPALKNKTFSDRPATPHETMVGKLSYYVETQEQRGLKVRVALPLTQVDTSLRRLKVASLAALPFVTLLSLLGGYWVAGRALRPVRKITEAAARITAEDLHQRLPLPAARDEIRKLTNVLNDAFERLERSYLQAMRFASDASHQLKTPLTVMRAAIESLLADAGLRPEQGTVLNDLLEQTRRLSSLTEGLLLLARADAGGIQAQPDETDVIPILERCIEDAEVLGSNAGIRIEKDLPNRFNALADPGRTEQILLNLLENAVKYNRQGGVIRVALDERGNKVVITVSNTGVPIPPERMPWIFDRFARGDRDESRAGHGLGLSIARELAIAQRGDVRLVRSDAEATEFELLLGLPGAKASDNPLIPLLTPAPRPAHPRPARALPFGS